MKIKIISAYNENFKQLSDLSFPSVESFCSKHGFVCDRFLISDYDRPPAWYKILAIKKNLVVADYVMWIDADAFILNQEFDLRSFLKDGENIYISKDFNGLNTGVCLFKNCKFSVDLLDEVYSKTEYLNHVWWEQKAFIEVFNSNFRDVQKHTKIIPQKILNSYDYRLYGFNDTHEGHFDSESFVVHYPSLPHGWRISEIKKMIRQYHG